MNGNTERVHSALSRVCIRYMEISLKLESMPTLCRSDFLPADTTITKKVAATIEVASLIVHRKEYCFGGIKSNNILPAPQQLTREPQRMDSCKMACHNLSHLKIFKMSQGNLNCHSFFSAFCMFNSHQLCFCHICETQ